MSTTFFKRLERYKPIIQIYKAETAAIGFAVATFVGNAFDLDAKIVSVIAVAVGYLAAYSTFRAKQ